MSCSIYIVLSSFFIYCIFTLPIKCLIVNYTQLSPYGHLAITDTSLLGTLCKSLAKPVTNYIAVALATTDSRYYGIADTSCGPQQTFLLFYSRYNGYLGSIFLRTQRESKVSF